MYLFRKKNHFEIHLKDVFTQTLSIYSDLDLSRFAMLSFKLSLVIYLLSSDEVSESSCFKEINEGVEFIYFFLCEMSSLESDCSINGSSNSISMFW